MMPQKKWESFLWSIILSLWRIIITSLKVIEDFFFLFSDVPLDIPKADHAVQSIFSLFISLTLKRVIMFRERCI